MLTSSVYILQVVPPGTFISVALHLWSDYFTLGGVFELCIRLHTEFYLRIENTLSPICHTLLLVETLLQPFDLIPSSLQHLSVILSHERQEEVAIYFHQQKV